MKKIAFTIAEILVVLSTIGVIMTLTVSSAINIDKIKEQKLMNSSYGFYTNVLNAFNEILLYEASDMSSLAKIPAENPSEGNGEKVADLFRKYLNGQKEDCDAKELTVVRDDDIDNGNSICGYFPGEIIAKVVYNPNCNIEEIKVSNYLIKKDADDTNTDNDIVKNACGFITYANINSKGHFGQDVFRIAFNKYRLLN